MNSFYDLETVKHLAETAAVRMGKKASEYAENEFGYSLSQVIVTILDLETQDFYKTYHYNDVPHDAYIRRIRSNITHTHKEAYIKFFVSNSLIIVSFHTETLL